MQFQMSIELDRISLMFLLKFLNKLAEERRQKKET
ncbi:hypothetical protein LEMLEM_LOCUS15559 [Lemmus lemmus]